MSSVDPSDSDGSWSGDDISYSSSSPNPLRHPQPVPVICPLCQQQNYNKSNLKRHLSRRHNIHNWNGRFPIEVVNGTTECLDHRESDTMVLLLPPSPFRHQLSALEKPAPPGMIAETILRIRVDGDEYTVLDVSSRLRPIQTTNPDPNDQQSTTAAAAIPQPNTMPAASPYKFSIPPPRPPAARTSAASPPPPQMVSQSKIIWSDDEDDEAATGDVAVSPSRTNHSRIVFDEGEEEQEEEEEEQQEQSSEDEGPIDDDDDDEDGEESKQQPRQRQHNGQYNNNTPKIREAMKSQLNKSGIQNFQLYLKKARPGVELWDLTKSELLDLIPDWILTARTLTGGWYRWDTFKGYLNCVQRIVRQFQPADEWREFHIAHHPSIVEATIQAREGERIRETTSASSSSNAASSSNVAAAAAGKNEMTTRRAERIANGETPINYARDFDYSVPSSAASSPRHSVQQAPRDVTEQPGYLDVSAKATAHPTRPNWPKLSDQQIAHLMSLLDPDVPQGLFRMNWINVTRFLGVMTQPEHTACTLRNFVPGEKVVKVRYTGASPAQLPTSVAPASTPAPSAVPVAASDPSPSPAVPAPVKDESSPPPTDASAVQASTAPSADSSDTPMPDANGVPDPSSSAPVATAATLPDKAPAPAAPTATRLESNGDVEMTDAPDSLPVATTAPTITAAAAPSSLAQHDLPKPPPPSVDPSLPFEVCDPADPEGVDRLVKFIMFVPTLGSRRGVAFMYERPFDGPNCPVALWNSYLSHRPAVVLSGPEAETSMTLWLQPRRVDVSGESEWFNMVHLGRITLSGVIATLTQGCGLPGGYSNPSVVHQPKRPISITKEELEAMKEAQRANSYGVPTKEQHLAIALQLQLNPRPRETITRPPIVQLPTPSPPPSTLTHGPSNTGMVPHTGHGQQSQQYAQSNGTSMPPMVPPYHPFPVSYDPTGRPIPMQPQFQHSYFGPMSMIHAPTHLMDPSVHQQLYARLDESICKHAAPVAMGESNGGTGSDDVPPLLPAGTNAPTAPSSTTAAPPLTLQPPSLESAGSLVSFIDRMQTEITTLTSYAATCQKSLDSFKALAGTLRNESQATLQLAQSRLKIAHQYEEIQMLKAQLNAKPVPDTSPTMSNRETNNMEVDPPPLPAVTRASTGAPTVSITTNGRSLSTPTISDEAKENGLPTNVDSLPHLVAIKDPSLFASSAASSASPPAISDPSTSTVKLPSRFSDSATRLIC